MHPRAIASSDVHQLISGDTLLYELLLLLKIMSFGRTLYKLVAAAL